MSWILSILLSLLAISMWVLTLLGLPGNWGLLLIAVGLAWFAQSSAAIDVDTPALITMLALATAGEVIEFVAGAAGVNKLGGSKKGAVLALLGSVAGAIVGMVVGVPVPIIGSLIAAVLFGGVGAFAGAVAGERWDGKEWEQAIQIGWGALWGKLLGTLLKALCGTILLGLLLYAMWS